MTNTQFITIADAAQRMSVSQKTIRRWIASGDVRAVRVGKKLIRVDTSSLDSIGQPLTPARAA